MRDKWSATRSKEDGGSAVQADDHGSTSQGRDRLADYNGGVIIAARGAVRESICL